MRRGFWGNPRPPSAAVGNRRRVVAAATFRRILLIGSACARMIAPMLFNQLSEVCREEFQKARRVLVAAYELMRAADERALQTLWMFFQDR